MHALAKLEPVQRGDFAEIFRAMDGLPVTVRLLDPPLHEFLPQADAEIRVLAESLDTSPAEVRARVDALHEFNPMLGHRGLPARHHVPGDLRDAGARDPARGARGGGARGSASSPRS